MSIQSASEMKAEYIEVMGEDLGEVMFALWQEVAELHLRWKEFKELFATKASRIRLLNESAPSFFGTVQDCLWGETVLHIARLTDPPETMGVYPNLSIQRIPGLVDSAELSAQTDSLIGVVLDRATFCRDWRNRHLAHRHLDLALEREAEPLEPASKEQVDDVLSAIEDVINAVTFHFLDSRTSFISYETPYGARGMLYVIADGLRAREKREQRLLNGDIDPDDMPPRDV